MSFHGYDFENDLCQSTINSHLFKDILCAAHLLERVSETMKESSKNSKPLSRRTDVI